MKLISVKSARSIWLVPATDINPKGKYLSHMVKQLAERYFFATFPTPEEIVTKANDGLAFREGKFRNKNGDDIYVSMTVHNDGIVVDARSSTDDCDSFISETLNWIAKENGLPQPSSLHIQKLYISELYVESEQSLQIINPKILRFSQSLSEFVGKTGHVGASMELTGLTFANDPALPIKPIPFRFERAEGVPFERNRYYSSAPLPTTRHIELLNEFEDILK